MYFIIKKVGGYIEEKMEYLILASTDKNEEVLTKYKELWDRIQAMKFGGTDRVATPLFSYLLNKVDDPLLPYYHLRIFFL